MSKRVSNKKGRSRRRPARSDVKYGWKRKLRYQLRLLQQIEGLL